MNCVDERTSLAKRYAAELRPARAKEIKRIIRFFARTGDPNVLSRPASEYIQAAQNEMFFLIELPSHIYAPRFVAAAGVFRYPAPHQNLAELGSAYVIKPFRGFGIQRYLIEIRVAAAFMLMSNLALITAVKPGSASSRNVVEAGFTLWAEPNPAVFEPCAGCASRPGDGGNRRCCCDFHHLDKAKSQDITARLQRSWTGVRDARESAFRRILRISTRGTGPGASQYDEINVRPTMRWLHVLVNAREDRAM